MVTRRQFGIGALAMAGDQLVRPLNAPTGQPLAYGTQPGVSTGIIRATQIIIFGPTGVPVGLFQYRAGTTPGPGNPPIIAISNSATDPFGNSIRPSGSSTDGSLIALGTGGDYMQLAAGATARLLIGTGDASELGPGNLSSLINGVGGARALDTILTSPVFVGGTAAELLLQSPSQDGVTTPSTAELLAGKILLSGGPVTATAGTAATPTLITTDTWHSISPGGTWTASGSGVNGFFYTLLPDGNVLLAWDVSNNNANPGTLGTLPAGYRPATTVRLQSGWGGTGPTSYNDQFSPMIQVAATGAITGGGLFVATLTLFGTAILPIGSL